LQAAVPLVATLPSLKSKAPPPMLNANRNCPGNLEVLASLTILAF